MRVLALLIVLTLSGCSLTTGGGRTVAVTEDIIAEICTEAWDVLSYDSKLDTPATVGEIRTANRSRAAFCATKEQ